MVVRVLVVDDSRLARIVLIRAIGALLLDSACVEAANAEAALAAIQHQTVDVAILDYNMPGKNGVDLADELRARFPHMPIAIATANIQDEIISRTRAAKAHFLPKPMTEEGLSKFFGEANIKSAPKNT
jgi:CheY-like chemotaxis protein